MTDLGPLSIPITATGITEVLDSFRSLEKGVQRLQDRVNSTTRQGSNRRMQQAKSEGDSYLKEEARKTKGTENERVRREREYDKLFASIDKSERDATKSAERESQKRIRQTEKEAREHNRIMRSMVGAGFRGAGGAVSSAMRWGGAALALGGGLSVAGALDHERMIHQEATSLSVATNIPGGKQINPQDAMNQAKGLAAEYGMNAEDILAGEHQFVARGGTAATNVLKDIVPEMVKIARAESVDPKELGEAMGIALKQNPSLNGKELIGLMNVLVAQGKAGSVELRQLAANLARTTASAPLYAGDQLSNQIKLAALAQKAVATAGGPEEAATDVNKFAAEILKHQKLFTAQGITTTNAKGELLPIETLLKNIFTKTGTDATKIEKLFPEKGGLRLLEAFLPDIKKFGLDETIKQLIASFHAYLTEQQKAADVQAQLNDPLIAFDKSMLNLQQALGTALIPAVESLTPKIVELTPKIVDLFTGIVGFVGWMADHPWTTAFAGIGAAVTKAIVGQIVASGISSAFSGAAINVGALGSAAASSAITLAIFAAALKVASDLEELSNAEKAATEAGKERMGVEDKVFDAISKGKLSGKEMAAAKGGLTKEMAQLQGRNEEISSYSLTSGYLGAIMGGDEKAKNEERIEQIKRDIALIDEKEKRASYMHGFDTYTPANQAAAPTNTDAANTDATKQNTAALQTLNANLSKLPLVSGGPINYTPSNAGGAGSGMQPPTGDNSFVRHMPGDP